MTLRGSVATCQWEGGRGYDSGKLACADEGIARNVLAPNDGLKQEGVLGVLGYAEVGHAWGNEVRGELDIDGDAVAALLVEDEAFDSVEGGVCGEPLCAGVNRFF